MKSIRFKLITIYLALVFIVMIVSGAFMITRVRISETDKAREEMRDTADNIYDQIILDYDDQEQFQNAFKSVYRLGVGRMQASILNAKGQTIASTVSQDESFSDKSIISAIAGEVGFNWGRKTMDVTGQVKEWLNFAAPFTKEAKEEGNDPITYVIYIRMDASAINDNLSELTMTIIIMIIIALALSSVMWFLFANTLTEPIITLTKKAREFANGNLNQDILVYGSDEIGQLTKSFNDMAKELSATISTMESEKNKVEVVLNNMTDGVLAYEVSGKLIHANFSCYEMLGYSVVDDVPFDEMLGRLGFESFDPKAMFTDEVLESTFSSGDKYISASITPYLNKFNIIAGVVIVLQDVTKHKRLDDMRKEFVANVSHELRTPLTTVKTYTETLLDGALSDAETTVDFLKVIDSEADRMALLVKDLLDLSKFDNNQLNLELESVDLAALVGVSIKQNIMYSERKNQKMIYDLTDKKYFIEGDAARLNQVFNNIIINSIKYSPEGSTIEVYFEETDKYYRVYVKDNGIGIAKEDLWRIFERFYRVDKARSRAMGGTGLGLAIAKEIVEAHGGKISATSEVGKGTTMILRFNKVYEFTEYEFDKI